MTRRFLTSLIALCEQELAQMPPDPAPSVWPNEPAGFVALSDQPWSNMYASEWAYLRRTSTKDDRIVSDLSAPCSPPDVLQIVFTPTMRRDTSPSVHWIGLPTRPRELYAAWWMKLSPNWTGSPAGGGKIAFLHLPSGGGQVYINLGGSAAPHYINVNTEWAPYGQKVWEPNAVTSFTKTPVIYDQWVRVEWYLKASSSPATDDGVIRWWVNGTLNGEYRTVQFPSGGFEQFEFSPTRQNVPPTEQYLYIDHTRVSAPQVIQ